MVAYEFYSLNPAGGYQVIGVLPERRKNPERVTRKSVMKWGKNILARDLDDEDIFFIQVTIDDRTVRVFRPIPVSITYEDIGK
jgi:hypothetical protein